MKTIKCSCGGKIYSEGTNRFICIFCKKEYKKISGNHLNSFEDLEEIQ